MQCNQSFCGNGFPIGPMNYNISCNSTPYQCSTNTYPEVVGEGEITSVTLPDGTIQLYFMPMVKWLPPNTPQCHPNMGQSMYTSPSHPPQWNNNVGTWFVRSICNPMPQNACNLPYQRCDAPRYYNNSEYNMNSNNNGYQLKFHNDNCTSTTDMKYIYPCLQCECVTSQQVKGNAAVQVDTTPVENTVCQYLVCTKPCNCKAPQKAMSVVSLKEPESKTCSDSAVDCSCDDYERKKRDIHGKKTKPMKNKPRNVDCACAEPNKNKTSKNNTRHKPMSVISINDQDTNTCSDSTIDCSCDDDERKKHNIHDKKTKPMNNKPKNVVCACKESNKNRTSNNNAQHKPVSLISLKDLVTNICSDSTVDCSCDDDEKEKRSKHNKKTKSKRNKLKNVICACEEIKKNKPENVVCACEETNKKITANKMVTTYSDNGCGSTPSDGRQTQTGATGNPPTCCNKPIPMFFTDKIVQRYEVNKAETWQPVTPFSKKAVKRKCSEKTIDNSDTDYNGECSSNCSCFSG